MSDQPATDLVVKGRGSGSRRQHEEQDRTPDQVLVPGLWVDEQLNGEDLRKQGQRGEAGGEACDQQGRAPDLERRCLGRREGRRQHGHLMRDLHVRLKIGNWIYEGTLVSVTDARERDAVLAANLNKYPRSTTGETIPLLRLDNA